MKKLVYLVVTVLAIFIQSCKSGSTAPASLDETKLSIVVDATDTSILNTIKADFAENLDLFFQNTGLREIKDGERLTVMMSPITASGELHLNKSSIGIAADADLPGFVKEKEKDPRRILQMIASELSNYDCLVHAERQLQSPIIDVLLKNMLEMSQDSKREVLLVFTDGFENSSYANFYKKIPTTENQVLKLMDKVDPLLLKEAKKRIEVCQPEIMFVLKCQNRQKADVKLFYTEFMRQLGVSRVYFSDNMSNSLY